MSRPVLMRREQSIPGAQAWAFLIGIAVALALGALLLEFAGHSPATAYERMWNSSFGSSRGIARTLNRAVPLALCGLAVAVAGSMGLWNIGAEGQLIAGAIGAAWVARIGGGWSGPVLIVAMIAGGMLFGGLLAAGPALARARLGVNEIITTLMLNEIALRAVRYLEANNWKDPDSQGFPRTPELPAQSALPEFFGEAHVGLFVALAAVLAISLLVSRTSWGYELRVAGSSAKSANYAGISLARKIFVVLALSGAIAGLAGAIEMTGTATRLTQNVANGYGFAGIIVAALALMRPSGIIPVAVVFAAVQVGGNSLKNIGVPDSVSDILQALILAGALVAAVFMTYRVRWVSTKAPAVAVAHE